MNREHNTRLRGVCASYLVLYVCLMLLGAGTLSAQTDTLNRFDNRGNRHGYWMRYNNDILTYEGRFENGVPTGLFVYYYENNKIKSTVMYSDRGRDAKTVMFHNNGSIMAIGKYWEQKKDSLWKYYNEYEMLVSSEEYVMGKAHGVWKKYNAAGQVIEEVNYRDGLKQGEWVQYFDNGKVKLRATYVDDLLEGRMIMYYSNDLPSLSGVYRRSLPVGMWMFYNVKGEVERKVYYNNGVKEKTEYLVPYVEPDTPDALREVNNFRRQLRNMGLD
jgi:antitoxin component YwqK of YwqJK toxin-antitoxin module